MFVPSIRFSGQAVRYLVVAAPVLVLMIIAGMLWLVGFFAGDDGRAYVLAVSDKASNVAFILLGSSPSGEPPPPDPDAWGLTAAQSSVAPSRGQIEDEEG